MLTGFAWADRPTDQRPPTDGPWVPGDVEQYGWTRWNPPDAGANQDITQDFFSWADQVGGDAVAGRQVEDVTGNEQRGVDVLERAVEGDVFVLRPVDLGAAS